ncbi:MAG TPA: hypothetical protein VMM78_19375 [Thermomicrobiales bacterium]|nr:hypothetical protein [Thermomicrobiales bacterium]
MEPRTLVPAPSDALSYDEARLANKRRLAILGLATGAVMALLVLACLLLLVLVLPD